MKLNKTFKKIFAAIMMVTMLCGGMNIINNQTTAKASTSPVQMYYTDHYFSKYGILQYTVYIQVDANSASNKAVYVHHSCYPDGWTDTEATFFKKSDDNTEIWKADISGTNTGKFAIKYIGDGITYWDNNNGQGYDSNDVLGAANVKALRRYATYPNRISVVVKNPGFGYGCHVRLRYTFDNWQTYCDVDMSYVSSGYGINGELWVVDLNLNGNLDGFQFCIYYEVNGQIYWDNNFGANYDKNYYRSY